MTTKQKNTKSTKNVHSHPTRKGYPKTMKRMPYKAK